MTFTSCPECGLSVSDVASNCPHCARARVTAQSLPRASAVLTSYPLFPVATHKFIVLSIFSFSAYSLYWFYQNWKRVKAASHESLSPFWRTAFAPLWGFSLFSRIRALSLGQGVVSDWSSGVLGATFFALNMAWVLPDPWGWMSLAVFAPLIPIQQTAHRINKIYANSVGETRNETYSAGNVAIILIGGLIFALFMTIALMPEWAPVPMITVRQ
jgi:hypothetical protein